MTQNSNNSSFTILFYYVKKGKHTHVKLSELSHLFTLLFYYGKKGENRLAILDLTRFIGVKSSFKSIFDFLQVLSE